MNQLPQNQNNNLDYITGYEWQTFTASEKQQYVEAAFTHWRHQGFPYPTYSDTLKIKTFHSLLNTVPNSIFLPSNDLHLSTVGIGLANSFHHNMWHVQVSKYRTPFEIFSDDEKLRKCIEKALIIWPRKRAASPSVLRDMLRTFSDTRRVSNFRPTVARAIYQRYSSPGSRILDFSAGYGGRLLGCLTLDREYLGYDPCFPQIQGSREMAQTISALDLTKTKAQLVQACAEDAIQFEKENSFDLIFSSPPYFNHEKYSMDTSQSYVKFPTYLEWKEGFLKNSGA